MAGRLIDQLFVSFGFRPDTSGLDRVVRKMRDVDRQVTQIARGLDAAIGAALGIGTITFAAGSKIERELLNLRTQLSETEESVEAIKPALEDLSSDTAVPLDRLAAGFFALRSAGLSTEAAMETLTASAHGVNAGMGDIRDIAHMAGGAVNAYGEDAMSGARATDILLGTVQKGNLIASNLTRGFGELLQVAPQLGVEMEQLGAIIAGGTTSSVSANVVMTQLRQILFGLLRPTETAKKQMEALGIDAGELARRVDEDLVAALQWLRQEAGDDQEAFSRLFESQEAVGLMFTITGEKAGDYREALDAIRDSTGLTNQAHEIWAQSGLAQVEKNTNKMKLTLNDLYESVLSPLLQLFGKLNSVVQQLIVGLGAASVASSLFGGPSLGKVIAALTVKLVRLRWVNRQLRIMRVVLLRRVVPALRGFVRGIGRAALATLRFAGRAIVAGISGVIAFGVAIWASMIPPLIAATAAVTAFTVALLANPVVLVITAVIGAFALLGFVVYKFRRQILGALKAVWSWVKGNWPLLVGILLGPFGIVGALIWKFRDKIIDAFVSIKDFFMGVWGTIVGIFRDHWAKVLAVIFPPVGLPILIAQEWDQIVGIVGGIWSRVYETVKGWIDAIISFIREIPGKVREAVKDIPNMVKDAVKDIPVVGQVLDVAGGVADKAKGFLGGIGKVFTGAAGGVVPGPLGRAVPSIIHGGEMVLPVGASRVIAQMLEGFRLGPAALPQAPHYYGQMYRSSVTNRTVNINITEPIVIHTEATDAKGIAQELGEAIQDQIRNIAYDHDGPVER